MAKIIRSWQTRGPQVRQGEKKFSQTLNVYVGEKKADPKKDTEYHVNVVLNGEEKEEELQEKFSDAIEAFAKKMKL